ncbi:hypothetical protein EJ06DRAFT_545620 [Trichodelitschia bisporula]|uniref:Uncharacterized protein n=1 Tax=Trichodelitschia bisporula TaxID=703511 RepID=A0A6G1IAJ2_9PEZI|nr:hypothetical protein EJ06DRAFT_545620 [Trichodelitschia bisporula]
MERLLGSGLCRWRSPRNPPTTPRRHRGVDCMPRTSLEVPGSAGVMSRTDTRRVNGTYSRIPRPRSPTSQRNHLSLTGPPSRVVLRLKGRSNVVRHATATRKALRTNEPHGAPDPVVCFISPFGKDHASDTLLCIPGLNLQTQLLAVNGQGAATGALGAARSEAEGDPIAAGSEI